jgi:hypothetical protein
MPEGESSGQDAVMSPCPGERGDEEGIAVTFYGATLSAFVTTAGIGSPTGLTLSQDQTHVPSPPAARPRLKALKAQTARTQQRLGNGR